MAVYCEKIKDQNVLDEIGASKKVLVIGCPSCTNISLSIFNDLPFIKYTPTGVIPVNIKNEIDYYSKLFKDKNISFDVWQPKNIDPLCCMHNNMKNKLFEKHKDVDCIIIISCEAGENCIKNVFKNIKTVRTMEAKGILNCSLKSGKINEIFIDKTCYNISKFTLNE
jgi:hypothetical protein